MNLTTILAELKKQIIPVGQFILEQNNKLQVSDIIHKGKNDLVSFVDKEAEKMIVKICEKLIPGAGFINEETGEFSGSNDYRWIIDPLDGTTNFISKIPIYSISIALQHQEKTVLGMVYELNFNEMFTAIKGEGAFLNDEKITVNPEEKLTESLLATGFPYTQFEKIKTYLPILEDFMRHSRGIRRLGSAAVDLAYVACGRFSGFFEYGLNAWDVAAGAFIIQEAGGIITDFHNGENYLFGQEILATNTKIHTQMLEIIEKHA